MSLKLNQKGISHYIVPLAIIVLVAISGVGYLVASHADSVNTSTTSTTIPTVHNHVVIFGPQDVTNQALNGGSTIPLEFIGSPTVSYVGAGQTMTYGNGIKANIKECYQVFVIPPKSGTATATVEFASQTNTKTVYLNSNDYGILNQVCVDPGTQANPGFNVKNLSSVQQNITVAVYEDIVSW